MHVVNLASPNKCQPQAGLQQPRPHDARMLTRKLRVGPGVTPSRSKTLQRNVVFPVASYFHGTSSNSDEEMEYDGIEDHPQNNKALQEYLEAAIAGRVEHAAKATIRCFNCTQVMRFAGNCPSCGHQHDAKAQLISVPLEYSRSAYVHMRQQRMRQELQEEQETAWLLRQQQQQQVVQQAPQQQQQPQAGPGNAAAPPAATAAAAAQLATCMQVAADATGPPAEPPAAAIARAMSRAALAPQLAPRVVPSPQATNSAHAGSSATATATTSSSSSATLSGTSTQATQATPAVQTASSSSSTSSSRVTPAAPSGTAQAPGAAGSAPLGGIAPVLLSWDDRTDLHHNWSREPREELAGLTVQSTMHPERPARTQAIVARLHRAGLLDACQAVPARHATEAELLRVHSPELVEGVRSLSASASSWSESEPDHTVDVGGDTYANRHTWEAATLAAGMAIDVALGVASGQGSHGAAVVRPPGHHAEPNGVMGFCFLNAAALAARAVQRVAGLERVAIVDWDVHHGNGAQHALWEDPSILTLSLHRHDGGNYFPGSGGMEEVGGGQGEGAAVNLPWPMPGMGDAEYLAAFDQVVAPVLREFNPQLVIVAAGFDSAAQDPLGGCALSANGFARMTAQLRQVAPVCLLLEGGYNLAATAAGFEACLRVLLGEEPATDESDSAPPAFVALQTISRVLSVQSRYWDSLQPLSTQQLMGRYEWLGARDIICQILERAGHSPKQAASLAP